MAILGRKAFTLIEIVVAVATIGILTVMAIPNFIAARQDTQKNTCMNNMKQIDYGKQQWALENTKATDQTPTSAEVGVYLRRGFPVCPSNGTYTINNVATPPQCNLHGSF